MAGTDLHRPAGGIQRPNPDAPTLLHQHVDAEAPLPHVDIRQGMRGFGQRALDFRAGGITACVHHPRQRVTAFDGERECAVLLVELRAEIHELSDSARSLGDQDVDRIGIAQSGTGDEGVGLMQLGRVGISEHRRDTALRIPGRRGCQLTLGDDADGPTALRRVDRSRQTGNAAAQHQEIHGGGAYGLTTTEGPSEPASITPASTVT